ncbi:MAG: Dam family site-specific DNA-(adenine-N6)-methyltransferase [Bacteroidetes bacterium]|nr:Dam family site-specific DNA-(adenine-N6)-methyltransferase [Bacteroidota bacterium]
MKQNAVVPFLKWPGGKRWFVSNHASILPKAYNRYIEPFLGGGAVFFHLQPENALLGDANADLISAYQALKTNWRFVKRSLEYHHRMHCTKHYYHVRDASPQNLLQQASRMIYLNRTCFNGIYRVNTNGQFNVPIGTKTAVIMPSDDFEALSKLLQNSEIRHTDFEILIDEANENDLIFVDPPYTVRHNLNGFIKYNEKLFSWEDQERLSTALIRAKNRGAKIVSTNANHFSVRQLYEGHGFTLKTVSRFSSISATPDNRKQFEELVILSNPNN